MMMLDSGQRMLVHVVDQGPTDILLSGPARPWTDPSQVSCGHGFHDRKNRRQSGTCGTDPEGGGLRLAVILPSHEPSRANTLRSADGPGKANPWLAPPPPLGEQGFLRVSFAGMSGRSAAIEKANENRPPCSSLPSIIVQRDRRAWRWNLSRKRLPAKPGARGSLQSFCRRQLPPLVLDACS